MAMVNVPHGLSFNAFTTTSAITASRMIENRDDRHIGDDSSQRPGFFLRHFGKRLAVAAHRKQQDHEILHAAGKHRASNHPKRSRQISKLSRQHRTDERPGPAMAAK